MTQPTAKYRLVADYIREGIQSGRFDPARRLPSEMELARRFKTSRPTVIRAMHELQSLGLIHRRVGSGTYIRERQPAKGVGGGTLGLIVAGLDHTEILEPICGEIALSAEARHYLIARGGTSAGQLADQPSCALSAEALCQQYIRQRISGVFFAPLELPVDRQELNLRIAESLDSAGIPVVLLDRDITDFPARSRFDLIGIDNFAAGFDLACHILQTGRRNLRFVARPRYPATTDQRLAGIREALLRANLTAPIVNLHTGDPTDAAFVRSLLESPRPDAIICSNDLTAAVLMRTLSDLGVRVPQDVALAGFDDVRYASLLSTPLTTMRQPCRALAAVAVQTMLERIAQPALPARNVLLTAELIARRSTGTI